MANQTNMENSNYKKCITASELHEKRHGAWRLQSQNRQSDIRFGYFCVNHAAKKKKRRRKIKRILRTQKQPNISDSDFYQRCETQSWPIFQQLRQEQPSKIQLCFLAVRDGKWQTNVVYLRLIPGWIISQEAMISWIMMWPAVQSLIVEQAL